MTFQFKMLCTIIKNKFLIVLNKVNITKQWMWLYASPVSAKGVGLLSFSFNSIN